MAQCPIGGPLKAGQIYFMFLFSSLDSPPYGFRPAEGVDFVRALVAIVSSLAGAAESAPEPFESNKISIFYLTRKGSGQASDSNSIPHALSESSGMQAFTYPALGYAYNPTKPDS